MSTTPVPDFKAGLKSFWQRPEGKTGAAILLATALAGVYGLSLILPWLIAFTTDIVHLAILGVGLFAIVYTVTNKTFRSIVSNSFQLVMRWTTGLLIQIDPIGILENTLDQMQDNLRKLGTAVGSCNGAKTSVEQQINKNNGIINKARSIVAEADSKLRNTKDPLTTQRIQLSRSMQLQEIGRRMGSNDKLQSILAQTTRLYSMLTRWQQLGDFNVENTRAEIDNAKANRTTILAAYKGMSLARKLIAGDPEQLKMMNADLEFLAQDNAMKLGEMEDFARYSEHFLTTMDLEQGAAASDAEKMLQQYETKLLSAGSPDSIPTETVIDVKAEPVPVTRSATNKNASGTKYFEG